MPSVKEIYHKIDDVRIEADTINLNVDGLEALASTQQADVAAIKADLADGIPVSVSSSTLPSGAATSANQTTANTSLSNIDTDLGAPADSAASTDTGSFSLISLFKRLLSTKLPDQSSGRIPVTLASAGTNGSAAPSNANLVGGTDGTNLRGLSVDSSGRLNTNINGTVPVSGSVTANNQSVYASGALTLSGTSALSTDLIPSTDVTAYQEVLVQVTGTWPTGATIQHQVSNDNVNFVPIVGTTALSSSGTLSSTISATSSNKVLLAGFAYYRLRVTAAGSAGTYSYAYTLNPRSSVFNTSVSVSSVPTTGVNISPSTGTGHSTHHTAISAASTNATNVKGSGANIGSLNLVNTTASLRYFKLFNLASAPTVGTSTPVLNYAIQPNSSMSVDCGFAGIRLSSGLSYAITAGQALLDNTAVGAGDVVVNIAYA